MVPAYNEEKVIVQTITSLLACDHPRQFEIIVVDDGSSDATYRVASETFAADPWCGCTPGPMAASRQRSILAWRRTGAEIVVALDADTVRRDTLPCWSVISADPTVGAVAGNAKVGNRINLLNALAGVEH